MSNGWRNLCFVLGAVCCWQAWRGCNRPASIVTEVECPKPDRIAGSQPRDTRVVDHDRDDDSAPAAPSITDGFTFYGVKLPGWTRSLLPQAGEDLRAYRDRMIPLAQLALAPHRSRVARSRDDFAKLANLDDRQRAELDAVAKETATAIQDRAFNAVLSGELSPSTFKPMAGVAMARDVLDLVERANKRFASTLSDDQRGKLAQHPFDFADYLVFSTKWEDAISGL